MLQRVGNNTLPPHFSGDPGVHHVPFQHKPLQLIEYEEELTGHSVSYQAWDKEAKKGKARQATVIFQVAEGNSKK